MLLLPLSRACAIIICAAWGAATAVPLGPVDYNDAEVSKTIPNCDFYKNNPGSCLTTSVDAPCKYCRTKVVRGFDAAECPGPESFHPADAGKKQWVVKPGARKLWVRKELICAVENVYHDTSYPYVPIAENGSEFLGLPSTAWFILLGIIFVAIIGGAAYALSGSSGGRSRRRRRRGRRNDYDDEEDDDDYDY